MKFPNRNKVENPVTRIQLNKVFESQAEMNEFVKTNHPTATIKQFWPVQMLVCEIEIPCIKK